MVKIYLQYPAMYVQPRYLLYRVVTVNIYNRGEQGAH